MIQKTSRPAFTTREFPLIMIYIAAISLSLMYVICRSHMVICTIIMTAAGCAVFLLFYALRHHKGFSALTVAALGLICAVAMTMAQSKTWSNTFVDFVFTASSFFDATFAAVCIIVFSSIIGFTCCYFSVYSPRPCFLMLPSFIPLILSARTAGGLPEGMLIFMLAGFAMSAAAMARPEYPNKYLYVDDRHSARERVIVITVAGAVVAALLAVIPRSDTTPKGEYLDSVFLNGSGYYAGSERLTNFVSTSSVNRGGNKPSGNLLFTVKAYEPVTIIRWAFDEYCGSDGWQTLEQYNTGYADWQNSAGSLNGAVLLYKLKNAAADGKLTDYAELFEDIPYSVANGVNVTNEVFTPQAALSIRVVDGSSTAVVMHPNATYGIVASGFSGRTYRTPRDEIFAESNFPSNAQYSVSYFSDEPNGDFIEAMESIDFERLLMDAVSENVISYAEAGAWLDERAFAREYYSSTHDAGMTEEIVELANEITEGLTTDYDKALAIERWFRESGFVYDMDYVPAVADAEYFIFNSQTGICSDFATAATLLMRAVGLSARYTEGFALSESIKKDDGLYYVTDAQAHAFSMVYLDGYGWLQIDPTKYVSASSGGDAVKTVLIIVVAGAALLAVLGIIFRKGLSELIFAATMPFRSPEDKILAVYLRTRALACSVNGKKAESAAVGEVRETISRSLLMPQQADIICDAADELLYGNGACNDNGSRLYRCYREIGKMKRRMKK